MHFQWEKGNPSSAIRDAAYRKHEGEPSHGHRQHAHKEFGKDRSCGSGDILADRQTDPQIDRPTDRHPHHNTSQPLPLAK